MTRRDLTSAVRTTETGLHGTGVSKSGRTEIDWYPPQLRDHERRSAKGSLWEDEWDAGRHESQVPPDPHQRNAALRTLNLGGGLVYAARVAGGVIKIGHTGNLAERLYNLGPVVELLAFMPGTYADEQALHAKLADHLEHGREWYYPTPGVMAVVNDMRQILGLTPVAGGTR